MILRKKTSDFSVFYKIFVKKEYQQDFGVNPEVILDIGANTGYASLWFAKNYPTAKIYALEPEKNNYAVLIQNTKIFPFIIPLNYAIWNQSSYLKISNPSAEKWAFTVEEAQTPEEAEFQGISMDDLIRKLGISKIDILKMDVEGTEKRIFTGQNLDWLNITHSIIIELHDHIAWGASKAFVDAMKKYNFHTFKSGENIVAIKN